MKCLLSNLDSTINFFFDSRYLYNLLIFFNYFINNYILSIDY